MDLLGLSEEELCRVLDVDPLTLLSGQLEHRAELPILLDLLDEASERAGPAVLARWVRASGPAGAADRRAPAPRLRGVRGRAGGARRRAASCCAAAAGEATVGEPLTHQLRVRYAECDPQGVVFNAHYLAYFDASITELWRAAFGSYQAMLDRGVDVVVAEAQLRFRTPAHFDEVLTLAIGVTHLGTTSIASSHRISRDGEVVVEGKLRHVLVEREIAHEDPDPRLDARAAVAVDARTAPLALRPSAACPSPRAPCPARRRSATETPARWRGCAAAATPAIVAASSAAAPTTFGRLAFGAVAAGGSVLSIRDHTPRKIVFPIRAAISAAIIANGLYRSFTARSLPGPAPRGQRRRAQLAPHGDGSRRERG